MTSNKTTQICLTNDFHRTTCNLRVAANGILSPSQVRRCRRTLCGRTGCTCGGNLSERGPQSVEIAPAYDDADNPTFHLLPW